MDDKPDSGEILLKVLAGPSFLRKKPVRIAMMIRPTTNLFLCFPKPSGEERCGSL